MSTRIKYLLTALLLLSGCFSVTVSASQKGYNIKICYPDAAGEKFYLAQNAAREMTIVDSVVVNSRGKATFKSKTTSLCGEYLITNKERTLFSLLFSHPVRTKEKISIADNHLTHKGSNENSMFIRYQNLIKSRLREMNNPEQLTKQIDLLINETDKLNSGGLLSYYFAISFPQAVKDVEQTITDILSDQRILNTSFLKILVNDFIRDQQGNNFNKTIGDIETLLSLCENNDIEAFIAYSIFEYYYNSKTIGSENICVHIAENYFLNERVQLFDNTSLALIRIYVEYNKHSLTGMRAPEITLYDTLLNPVSFTDIHSDYKIVYFFDDQCSVCREETPKLLEFISSFNSDKSIVLYAVYTGDDRIRMQNYIRQLDASGMAAGSRNMIHYLWDPFSASDFGKLYSVLIKPQMFLIDGENTILGRNLSTATLSGLLKRDIEKSSGLHVLFDAYFEEYLSDPDNIEQESIYRSIDILYSETKNDEIVFREIFKELYFYLKNSALYELQLGAVYLGEEYIVNKSDIWGVNSDFYQGVEYSIELFYRNPLGTTAVNLELFDSTGNRKSLHDSKSEYTVLYFYDIDCPVCEIVSKDLQAISGEYNDKIDVTFLSIYVGTDYTKWHSMIDREKREWIELSDTEQTSGMFSKYNLSTVPSIYVLDRDKTVIAKDITPLTLKALFSYICNGNNP